MADNEPVIEELARHGDLTLVRSSVTGRFGLLRDGFGGRTPAKPVVAFDREEWRWLAVCAAPLALQLLGPEPAAGGSGPIPDPAPVQAELDLEATRG